MLRKTNEPRPLHLARSLLDGLHKVPTAVQREMGYALFLAQMGEHHPRKDENAQRLRRRDGGRGEGKSRSRLLSCRLFLAVRYADAVYVLHAFQKKSKKQRQDAEIGHENHRRTAERPNRRTAERPNRRTEEAMTRMPAAKDPTRNVWLQLGFPDAEEHYLKAELVLRLDRAIRVSGLTQRVAAQRIGTTQPELSKILRGKFSEVSLERLMRFLNRAGTPHRNQDRRSGASQGWQCDGEGRTATGRLMMRSAVFDIDCRFAWHRFGDD